MDYDKISIINAPLTIKVGLLDEKYYEDQIRKERARIGSIVSSNEYTESQKKSIRENGYEIIEKLEQQKQEMIQVRSSISQMTAVIDNFLIQDRISDSLRFSFEHLEIMLRLLQNKQGMNNQIAQDYHKRIRKIDIQRSNETKKRLYKINENGKVEAALKKISDGDYRVKVTGPSYSDYMENGSSIEVSKLGLVFQKANIFERNIMGDFDSFTANLFSSYTGEQSCKVNLQNYRFYYEKNGHKVNIGLNEGIDYEPIRDYIHAYEENYSNRENYPYSIPLQLLDGRESVDVSNILKIINIAKREDQMIYGMSAIESACKTAVDLSMELKVMKVLQKAYEGAKGNIPEQYAVLEEMANAKKTELTSAIEEVKNVCEEYHYDEFKDKLLAGAEVNYGEFYETEEKNKDNNVNNETEEIEVLDYEVKEDSNDRKVATSNLVESIVSHSIDSDYRSSIYYKYNMDKMRMGGNITFVDYLEKVNNGEMDELIELEKQKELLVKKVYKEYKENVEENQWLNVSGFVQYCSEESHDIQMLGGMNSIIKEADILDFMEQEKIRVEKQENQKSYTSELESMIAESGSKIDSANSKGM